MFCFVVKVVDFVLVCVYLHYVFVYLIAHDQSLVLDLFDVVEIILLVVHDV